MDLISIITVIIMAVTILFTITPQLHILQLNSYYNVRFWGYLKENIKTSSIMSVVFSALVCVLFFVSPVASLVLASLLSVIRVSHAIYKTKTAKKKISHDITQFNLISNSPIVEQTFPAKTFFVDIIFIQRILNIF